MDSQFILGRAILMKGVKYQPKLPVPKILQQFGIETACTVISNSVFKRRNFNDSYCDKVESSFTLDNFQHRFSRYLNLFLLGGLFKHTKLSLDIWFLISRAIANESSLVLKRRLHQSPHSPWFLELKFMQTMVERQAFSCVSQVEHLRLGEEFNGSGSGRCSGNKMCFETTAPLSNCGVPLFFQLFLVLSIARCLKRSSSCAERDYQSLLMLGFVSSEGLNSFWIP